jgi:putative ABC transport system ATP-binding protein
MPIVETRDLVRRYRLGGHEVRALDGVTLGFERGEFTAVMGRSGSGKSTLLNLIGCLDRPTSGEVILDGVVVSETPERELPKIRRDMVGFIFQHFNLVPALTALENVMLPLKYARLSRAEARRTASAMLEAVEMGQRLGHRPSELSGGEQQRVAIARALVNRPAVVLADEPTGEVDTETAVAIVRLMRDLNRSLGQTFLIVTHDSLVAEQTGRIVRLKDGWVESDAPVATTGGSPRSDS